MTFVMGDAPHPAPIPIILYCPECGQRHIDTGEFATKPHHTHSCQHCGVTWRPAVVPTVGVKFLPGFKSEPDPFEEAAFYTCVADAENFVATDPQDAIRDALSEPAEVTVYAYAPVSVPPDFVSQQTIVLVERLADDWTERWELGDPEKANELPGSVIIKLHEACDLMAKEDMSGVTRW